MPFEKGKSGNPGGRPKAAFKFRETASKFTQLALDTLVRILQDEATEPRDRIGAAKVVLEYGVGKPSAVMDERGQVEIATMKAKLRLLESGKDPDAQQITVVIPESLKRDGE